MSLEDKTLGEIKKLLAAADEARKALGWAEPTPQKRHGEDDAHWKIGHNYFIRTVTHHLLGTLEKVTPLELVLTSVSWIADDGRFNALLAKGEANEVEPAPAELRVIVGRGSLIDAYPWTHPLLRDVK